MSIRPPGSLPQWLYKTFRIINVRYCTTKSFLKVILQIFIALFFIDLYRLNGDSAREHEGHQMHKNFSQLLLRDHYRASQLPEHALIQWTDGQFPALPPPSAQQQQQQQMQQPGTSRQQETQQY